MNERLRLIYSLIEPGTGVIDVGTDHGYIPCALAQNEYEGNIIASDINEDPLKSAVRSAELCGVEKKIKFTVSDGLCDCNPDEIDTIIIAGMGGDTICSVLDRAEWCLNGKYQLILQPMTKKEVLRFWLVNNGFDKLDEYIAIDCGKIYQVIKTGFTGKNSPYTDAELFTGKFDPEADHFHEMLDCEMARAEKRLAGLISGQADEAILNFNRCIVEDMHRMKEQLNRYDKSRGYL